MTNRITTGSAVGMIRVDSELEWKYAYFAKERQWFAFCETLQIALQSSSLDELKQDMIECVDNLFTELAKSGRLKAFLEKHGWELKQPLPKKKTKSTVDMSVRFERVEEHDLQEAFC